VVAGPNPGAFSGKTMALYKKNEFGKLLKSIEDGSISPVYLLFGERYLCREAAAGLVLRLLPDEAARRTGLKTIDGEQENPAATIGMLKTYSLFGGRQVFRVSDSQIFHSRVVAEKLWEKAQLAWEEKDQARAGRYLAQMLALAELTPADWQKEDIGAWPPARWQEAFGFARPEELAWAQELCATAKGGVVPPASFGADGGDLLLAVLEAGIPPGNILILLAETVDRRKKLFKHLEKHGVVVDLALEAGTSSAARADQEAVLKEIVKHTLDGFGKKLELKALPVFLERVGFNPLAAVMEAEKLALFAGERTTITMDDLNAMVGRTREEAIFELNEAVGRRDPAASLIIARRLQENGMYPLAVLSGVRNFLRKLLFIRAISEDAGAGYREGLSYAAFQKAVLPGLAENRNFTALFGKKGKTPHPFAVYKSFQQAEMFSLTELKQAQAELLEAEYRIKGSGLPASLVMENFLLAILGHTPCRPKNGNRVL